MSSCFRDTVKTGGIRSLFTGLGVCLLRALPTNAVGFLTFELTMLELTKNDSHY